MKRKTTLKLNDGYVLEIKTDKEIINASMIKMMSGCCSGIGCGECPFRIRPKDQTRSSCCLSYNEEIIPREFSNGPTTTTRLNLLKAMGY